jgi:hypothetical protein
MKIVEDKDVSDTGRVSKSQQKTYRMEQETKQQLVLPTKRARTFINKVATFQGDANA